MTATKSELEKKCPLQRDPDRKNAFLEKDGFWWSTELNCWMISVPEAIAAVLKDANFIVHSYKFSEIVSRLGIRLPHHEALRVHLPLAFEGGQHATLRRQFSEEISANTSRALGIFERELTAAIGRCFSTAPPSRFCAVKEIMKPAVRSANLAIAGLNGAGVGDIESLPIFFDEGISLKSRQQIERLIESLYASLPDTMSADEKYFRIAMLALNINTLLGSLSESFLTVVRRNPDTPTSTMDWDADLPATALPMIERKALANAVLLGHEIKMGDRVRLFVDVDEFDRNRGAKYTDLYFAAGPHKCPGMNYSRQIWNIFVRHMRRIDIKLRIRDFSYRSNDGIFTFLDKLEIETYA